MIKSIRFIAINVLSLFACFFIVMMASDTSLAYYEWYIREFDVQIDVAQDSSLKIREHIKVDFDVEKHGIYREIPVEYINDVGLNYNLRLRVESVTDNEGNAWIYQVSGSGGNVFIRIGDPNAYAQGPQDYVITYSVERGMRFFDEFDELYWNVTGNEWDVPIGLARMTVRYPEADPENIKTICFTGSRYSRKQNCTQESYGDHAVFTAKGLGAYEGLTASVSLPKGLLAAPSLYKNIAWFAADNWGFSLPFLALLLLYYLWYTRGRDPKKYHTVVVEFSAPDDMTPAEMGTLLDESADMKDISAEIIHLAVNKHLVIEEVKKQVWIFSSSHYILKRVKDKESQKLRKPLTPHQEKLINALFSGHDSVKISDLKEKFYKSIPDIQKALYGEVVEIRKYFLKNPSSVRTKYFVTGAVILFLSFFGFGIFAAFERLDLVFGTLLVGPVFMIMARLMPRKTLAGAEAHRKVLGFKDYINTAEKYRVKFQEDQDIFERFLPYAMIFGLADKWADAFKGIYKGKPDWYRGQGDFSPNVFVSRINNFAHAANSTLASRPSSKGSSSSSGFGGGGFSGGGFGGGGGRSW